MVQLRGWRGSRTKGGEGGVGGTSKERASNRGVSTDLKAVCEIVCGTLTKNYVHCMDHEWKKHIHLT